MLQVGQEAPEFELPDADMKVVRLADYRGAQNVVLYFYPKDDTPGCTIEAVDFSNLEDDFAELETVVLGVSKDNCASHGLFRDKHGLTVRLLSDVDDNVAERYGAWQEKERNGERKMGMVRSTLIIDKNGIVRHTLYGVNAKKHAEEVLGMVRRMQQAESA